MTVRDALNSALDEELSRDPMVYVMGEEVRSAWPRQMHAASGEHACMLLLSPFARRPPSPVQQLLLAVKASAHFLGTAAISSQKPSGARSSSGSREQRHRPAHMRQRRSTASRHQHGSYRPAAANSFALEQVGEYQGAYKITRGLLQKYGADRVRDTPITEVRAGWAAAMQAAACSCFSSTNWQRRRSGATYASSSVSSLGCLQHVILQRGCYAALLFECLDCCRHSS